MATTNINLQIDNDRKINKRNHTQNSDQSDKEQRLHSKNSDEIDFENDADIIREPEIREKMIAFQRFMNEKDYPNAEQEITKMINIKKGDASLYYLRAEVYMKQNKYIQSLQDMNIAIKYEPMKQCTKSSQYHYEFKKTLMQMSNDI